MKNWDDIRFFLAVARAGSLNAAAKALAVDQSTVFRRLRALESDLGAQLFDRRQHGKYELTVAGESLYQRAGEIESATYNIEREVQGRDLQLSGRIRVTTPEDIAVVLLPRLLADFHRRYPSISIELLTANRFFNLNRGEADVAIRPGEHGAEGRIVPKQVCAIYFGLFASEAYLRKRGTPRHEPDLERHHLIGWSGELGDLAFDEFIAERRNPSESYGSNSLMAQRAMAEQDLGIAFLPEFVGDYEQRLVRVLPRLRIDSGHIWILHHDDLRRAARVRAFVDFMYSRLRDLRVLKRS